MAAPRLPQAIAPVAAALGINAVPAAAVFGAGAPAETAMLLYFLENLIGILLTTGLVRFMAPARDDTSPNHRTRRSLLSTYLMVALGFTLITGIFTVGFLYTVLDATIPREVVAWGAGLIIVFEAAGLVMTWFRLRPLSLGEAEMVLSGTFGRIFLLYLAVFIGMVLALFLESWFVWPFIILKTMADVGGVIQTLRGDEKPTFPT